MCEEKKWRSAATPPASLGPIFFFSSVTFAFKKFFVVVFGFLPINKRRICFPFPQHRFLSSEEIPAKVGRKKMKKNVQKEKKTKQKKIGEPPTHRTAKSRNAWQRRPEVGGKKKKEKNKREREREREKRKRRKI